MFVCVTINKVPVDLELSPKMLQLCTKPQGVQHAAWPPRPTSPLVVHRTTWPSSTTHHARATLAPRTRSLVDQCASSRVFTTQSSHRDELARILKIMKDLESSLGEYNSVSFQEFKSNIGIPYSLESSFLKELQQKNLHISRKLVVLNGILSWFSDDIDRLDPHDDEYILKACCISQLEKLQKYVKDKIVKNKKAVNSF